MPDQPADEAPPARPGPGRMVGGAGGVPIATWDLGGRGPAVLCTHGTGFHAWMWLGVAPELAPSHRVWSMDLRGHGGSGPSPDRTYRDWWVVADDVLAVVDALELERPAGVGHSMGAAVLLMAELRRPGTFSSLWCYEPIVPPPGTGATDPAQPSLAELALRRRNHFDSAAAAVERFGGRPPFAGFAPGLLEAFVEHAVVPDGDGVGLVLTGPEEATCYEGASLHGAWDRLGELALPVTVATGSVAIPGPARWGPDIAARVPGARLERFDHLSHMGPMEDPTAVGRAIAAFLGDPATVERVGGPGSTDAVPPPR